MQATEANVAAIRAVVSSMSGMPHFPFEPDARGALVAAFIEFPTFEEAEEAAAQFRRYSETCPTECDINRAAAAAKQKRAALHAETCQHCDGTGFIHREIAQTETVADFCGCEYGKLLQGKIYGRANRMDQLRARGVICEQCHGAGEVLRKIPTSLSVAEPCDCRRTGAAA